MKLWFERLGAVVIPLSILVLAGCGRTATQEVTPVPTLTPHATLPAVTTPTPARDPLGGTRWVLVSLYGAPPLEGTRITLEFSGGFIRGFAGCNEYNSRQQIGDAEVQGQYRATEDGSLETPGVTRTLLACLTPEGANEQENVYLKALGSAVAFRRVENRLELQDAVGETVLVFSR